MTALTKLVRDLSKLVTRQPVVLQIKANLEPMHA